MSDTEPVVAEYEFDCDFCGGYKQTQFCTLCGLDYCLDCKIVHVAQHEFVEEVTNQ